jgi:putative PIN family toxin of toxin-antitoxin system
LKVVFDTNVVASASFWRGPPFDCLAAWAQGRCEASVSPELLAEYHETLERLRREYPHHSYVEWVEALTDSAVLVFPAERARGATPDPGDEKILECALAGDADIIITGDRRHLQPLRMFRDTEIISPADFLRRLAPAARS